jgi:DNA-directed RNA polymerase specialized sigma24 family protein
VDKSHENRRRKVYYWAISFGLPPEEAEEMAQEFELARLEGRSEKQNSKLFVIDQLRKQGFDVSRGHPSTHDARKELKIEPSAWSNPDLALRIETALKGYSLEDRVILVLTNLWGLTPREIGFVIGLPEWRTVQRIRELETEE